jgi:hypothetical protein
LKFEGSSTAKPFGTRLARSLVNLRKARSCPRRKICKAAFYDPLRLYRFICFDVTTFTSRAGNKNYFQGVETVNAPICGVGSQGHF